MRITLDPRAADELYSQIDYFASASRSFSSAASFAS
jgi:hypothetical protein